MRIGHRDERGSPKTLITASRFLTYRPRPFVSFARFCECSFEQEVFLCALQSLW